MVECRGNTKLCKRKFSKLELCTVEINNSKLRSMEVDTTCEYCLDKSGWLVTDNASKIGAKGKIKTAEYYTFFNHVDN